VASDHGRELLDYVLADLPATERLSTLIGEGTERLDIAR
jgi:hypothetical protein